MAALYTADTICLVANPDVPCVRNAQRLLERVRQLGPAEERVRVLLNRAAEPFPIPPAQIQSALGHPIYHMFPSDYKTVSAALNSGVPLDDEPTTPTWRAQFDRFTRRLIDPSTDARRRQRPRALHARPPAIGFDLVTPHVHCRRTPSVHTDGS